MKDLDYEVNQSYCRKKRKKIKVVMAGNGFSIFLLFYFKDRYCGILLKKGNNKELEKICQEDDYILFTDNWAFLRFHYNRL